MKRMSVALTGFVLLSGVAFADDSKFLKEIDDLPLAPGLVEQPGGTLFDSPQGRIVEATAQGSLMEVEARQFYDESLPELGWTPISSGVYRRDKEVLTIDYSEGMPMVVHFSLEPLKTADKKSKSKEKSDNDDDKGDNQ